MNTMPLDWFCAIQLRRKDIANQIATEVARHCATMTVLHAKLSENDIQLADQEVPGSAACGPDSSVDNQGAASDKGS